MTDINECDIDDPCDSNSVCVNTPGSRVQNGTTVMEERMERVADPPYISISL